jgi:hypothetical protein
MPSNDVNASDYASHLLDRAASEPAEVLEEGPAMLRHSSDADSRAVIYRAMSIAARDAATLEE